eukprot:Hpha_TRINITY_DN4016_c0_g1::TRINITY_DN4016_c0_g1_i1::g.63598::m.63598
MLMLPLLGAWGAAVRHEMEVSYLYQDDAGRCSNTWYCGIWGPCKWMLDFNLTDNAGTNCHQSCFITGDDPYVNKTGSWCRSDVDPSATRIELEFQSERSSWRVCSTSTTVSDCIYRESCAWEIPSFFPGGVLTFTCQVEGTRGQRSTVEVTVYKYTESPTMHPLQPTVPPSLSPTNPTSSPTVFPSRSPTMVVELARQALVAVGVDVSKTQCEVWTGQWVCTTPTNTFYTCVAFQHHPTDPCPPEYECTNNTIQGQAAYVQEIINDASLECARGCPLDCIRLIPTTSPTSSPTQSPIENAIFGLEPGLRVVHSPSGDWSSGDIQLGSILRLVPFGGHVQVYDVYLGTVVHPLQMTIL